MKSISYKLRWRRRPSCLKKGVFCMQEGHVLERRRAWSATLKSMDYMQGERKMLTRGEVGRGDLPQPLRRRGAPSCYEKTNDICSWGYLIYYINKSTLILIVNT